MAVSLPSTTTPEKPGLLEQAAVDLGIDLDGSYLVGDAWTDIQAGLAVGCNPFLALTGRGLQQVVRTLCEAPGRFLAFRDLLDAATAILEAEGSMSRKGSHAVESAVSARLEGRLSFSLTGHALPPKPRNRTA